jgi:hypothetical protein
MSDDFVIDFDRVSDCFMATPQSSKAYDFLDEYATADSEFWGKSLMLRDVKDFLAKAERYGLTVYCVPFYK